MREDKVNDRWTYGAAIEVPEIVLDALVEPIQAEVTRIPRYQTRKLSGKTAVWCSERRHTFERLTKIGGGSLGMMSVD